MREKGILTLEVPWDELKIRRRLDTNILDTGGLKILEDVTRNRGVRLPYVASINETGTYIKERMEN